MASSVLASQLKKLALARGGDAPLRVKGKPSLLYDPREAADVDLQTIFENARTGIFELSNLDGRFVPYQKTLFGTQTLTLDRDQLSPEENKKLKSSLGSFLRLLSGYLLLHSAHQVLEYLIRLYKIQLYDVDPLLRSLLPYHASSVFVRLVQLAHINATPWEFLTGVQKSGSPVPRDALVQRCTHDLALMDIACEMALDSPPHPPYSRSAQSCAAVLLLEALAAVAQLSPALVGRVVPHVMTGLANGGSEDAQAAALMVVMQLANRTTLAQPVLAHLVATLASSSSSSSTNSSSLPQERLCVLLHLTQTQPVQSIPPKALAPLLNEKQLEAVTDLSLRFAVDKLVGLLLSAMLHSNRPLLLDCIQRHLLPLHPPTHVPNLTKEAIALCFHVETGEEVPTPNPTTKSGVEELLVALEHHHPAQMGPCLASILPSLPAPCPLFSFLHSALEGSLNVPLHDTGCPLLVALDHVEGGVREAALRHLALLPPDSIALDPQLRAGVERRLGETEWGLLDLTLACDLLLPKLFPPPHLLSHLKGVANRAAAAVGSGQKGARKVLKRALGMVGELGRDHPILTEQAAKVLLPFLLLLPKSSRLTRQTVLPAAAALRFPLFEGLPQPDPEGGGGDGALNEEVVRALAEGVAKSGAGGLAFWRTAAAEDGAVHPLLLLLLLHLLCTHPQSELEEDMMGVVEEMVPRLPLPAKMTPLEATEVGGGIPVGCYAQLGGKGGPAACAHLLLRVCHAMADRVGGREVGERLWTLCATSLPASPAQPLLLQLLKVHQGLRQVALFVAKFLGPTAPLQVKQRTVEAVGGYLRGEGVGGVGDEDAMVLLCLLLTATACESHLVRGAAVDAITLLSPIESVRGLVEGIGEAKTAVAADGRHISSLLPQLLSSRMDAAEICRGLTRQALGLPPGVKLVVLQMMEGVGWAAERTSECRVELEALLGRRMDKEGRMEEEEIVVMETMIRMYTVEVASSMDVVLQALEVGPNQGEGGLPATPAVTRPMVAAAHVISSEVFEGMPQEMQARFLFALLSVVGSEWGGQVDVKTSAQDALGRINIPPPLLMDCLTRVAGGEAEAPSAPPTPTPRKKKKKVATLHVWPPADRLLPITAALLTMMLDKEEWGEAEAVPPLLLTMVEAILDGIWAPTHPSSSSSSSLLPLLLRVLESMAPSATSFTTSVAVRCFKEAGCREATSLLTTLLREGGEGVVEAVVRLVSDQTFSHPSDLQRLLTAVLPLWAAQGQDAHHLMPLVVRSLPTMPPSCRMEVVRTALRAVGEEEGLPIALLLLLTAAAEGGEGEGEGEGGEWAVELCDQLFTPLPPPRQLSSLAAVLKGTGPHSGSSPRVQKVGVEFVANQMTALTATEEEEEEVGYSSLLEQVLVRLRSGVDPVVVDHALSILASLTHLMSTPAYLHAVQQMMSHPEEAMRRKVLQLLHTRVGARTESLSRRQRKQQPKTSGQSEVGKEEAEQYAEVAHHITPLLSKDSPPTLLAAFQALTGMSERYGASAASDFALLLPAVTPCFTHKSRGVVLASMRCMAAIGCAVGPLSLPWLPHSVPALLSTATDAVGGDREGGSGEVLEGALGAVERLVGSLGAFLSPYLPTLLTLTTHPACFHLPTARGIRELLPTKIPARVLLDPLLAAYPLNPLAGEGHQAAAVLSLLALLSQGLDRAAVSAYHTRLYTFLLTHMDTRRKAEEGKEKEVEVVEAAVLHATSSLVMKLSETSFKPMFVAALDWTQRGVIEEQEMPPGGSRQRNTAFFGLVDVLTEKLRSVFVPYYSYLLDLCITHLTGSGPLPSGPKKKKKKKSAGPPESLSWEEWHLRIRVLSCLHKCFLYDTTGFLDGPRFQRLLDPIVAQIELDPPPPPEGCADRKEAEAGARSAMESALVACLGQMALTSGSDVLWKQLNYSVLMCTRSEKVRARATGLAVVGLLVERLKEEYLVLLPETLPFLAEVLEDTDADNVAKAQGLVKGLEELSGEDLAQYL